MSSFVGFSKSTLKFPILGWIIMALQKWRYSHSFIAIYIEQFERWYVIDATGHGVRVRSMERFLEENQIVKSYKLNGSIEKNMKMLEWGLDKSGLKYPKIEIIGNLIQLLSWNLFKKIISNPFGQGENRPRCNELCAQALVEFENIQIEKDLDSIDLIWLDNLMEKNLKCLR